MKEGPITLSQIGCSLLKVKGGGRQNKGGGIERYILLEKIILKDKLIKQLSLKYFFMIRMLVNDTSSAIY